MQGLPLWMRLGYWMLPLGPAMQAPICLYSKTLLNGFPGNCRITLFISRSKSVSQNFGRVQAGAFHEVIHVHRLVCVSSHKAFSATRLRAAAANRLRCSASGCSA